MIWGEEPISGCHHEWIETITNREYHQTGATGRGSPTTTIHKAVSQNSFCSFCGAWKGQLGLEPTPELYLDHLVLIFREVRRVLRKDGVVFLNIGDSYSGSNSGKGDYREKKGLQKDIYDYEHPQANAGKWDKWRRGIGGEENGVSLSGIPRPSNLKSKNLCLIPFRLAIALQEDGWWVRSVIIWNKPNPMPESVRDRPTESHEYILMLTKSSRYFWDSIAVRESGIIEGFTGSSKSLISADGFLGKNAFAEQSIPPSSSAHNRLGKIAIDIASSILNFTEFQTNQSLRFFDAEIGQQSIDSIYGRLIGDSPSMKEAAVFANRLLMTDMTAECFLKQLDNLKIGITDSQQLGIRRISTLMSNTPFTRSDTDAPLTINNPSQVSQQQFILHNKEYSIEQDTLSSKVRGLKTKGDTEILGEQHHGQDIFPQSGGRNLRSVWSFPTQSFSGAHFATYPEKLVELCVKAATPEVGCCSKCGKPWVRIVEKGFKNNEYKPRIDEKYSAGSEFMSDKTTLRCDTESQTLGWKQACKCQDADKVPSIVLDPFAGSGTTLKVAAELNRRAIGYELSQDYCSLAVGRNKQGIIL